MILASHGIIASQIASFDADAVAFFNRVTTAGGTLSTTEKQAVNQLVLDLKANSLWTPMKAIYPMVGASAAACAQNLKSSSFTGTFSSGWTFASTGVTGNGTSAYFNTTVTNNIDITDRASHWSTYLRTLGNSGFHGYYNGVDVVFGVQPNATNQIAVGLNNLLSSGASSAIGYLVGSVNSSTSAKLYRNNSNVYSITNPSSLSSFNLDFYLGALNNLGSPILYSTQQIAFSSLGDNLTDTQASNFYTAVQAFQTTLSRNV
jgi:hypothetical protein